MIILFVEILLGLFSESVNDWRQKNYERAVPDEEPKLAASDDEIEVSDPVIGLHSYKFIAFRIWRISKFQHILF